MAPALNHYNSHKNKVLYIAEYVDVYYFPWAGSVLRPDWAECGGDADGSPGHEPVAARLDPHLHGRGRQVQAGHQAGRPGDNGNNVIEVMFYLSRTS